MRPPAGARAPDVSTTAGRFRTIGGAMPHKRVGHVERVPLETAAPPDPSKVLNPPPGGFPAGAAVALVILAAGKGTRFGTSPKCVQPVRGIPLARHSIDAFRRLQPAPCICLVGYAHDEEIGRAHV